jgi:hypothetical protein
VELSDDEERGRKTPTPRLGGKALQCRISGWLEIDSLNRTGYESHQLIQKNIYRDERQAKEKKVCLTRSIQRMQTKHTSLSIPQVGL